MKSADRGRMIVRMLDRLVAWIPPTWLVMLAGALGFVVGPIVLWVGAGSEMRTLLDESGPFTLWSMLIGVQTMLWILASVPLGLILARHWQQARSERLSVGAAVLPSALLLAGLVFLMMYAASKNPVPEFLPYATWKVRVLTVVALLVSLVAAASVWIVRARLERMADEEPTKGILSTYLLLRADLDRLLAYLGAVVGLAVLSSAAMRNVVRDVLPASLVDFPAEAVILYGLVLSLILAAMYLPTLAVARLVGGRLRDKLAPFPEPDRLIDGFETRKKLDDALGLTVSTTASFRAAVAILSPLLGGLASLLPKIGGG